MRSGRGRGTLHEERIGRIKNKINIILLAVSLLQQGAHRIHFALRSDILPQLSVRSSVGYIIISDSLKKYFKVVLWRDSALSELEVDKAALLGWQDWKDCLLLLLV